MYENLVSAAELKRRGWTAGMIRRFLPTPDRTARNPVYKSMAPMKLYMRTRVNEIESATDFSESQAKAKARQQSHDSLGQPILSAAE